MDNEWNYNEELEPMPEHHIDPEFTPEYPDVTFFKESYVTMREDNIFQGETPQGESPRNIKEEKQAKRSRKDFLHGILLLHTFHAFLFDCLTCTLCKQHVYILEDYHFNALLSSNHTNYLMILCIILVFLFI